MKYRVWLDQEVTIEADSEEKARARARQEFIMLLKFRDDLEFMVEEDDE